MKLSDQITRRQLFLVAFGSSQQSGGLTSVDLAATRDENRVILTASDGSAAPVDGADASTAGVMTAADKTALDQLSTPTLRAFGARSEIPSTTIGAGITHLRTAGFAAAADGGGASYKRVGSEPSHALKVQSADGAWWEIAEPHIIAFQACGGVEGDNAANGAGNVTAFNDFIGYLQDQAGSGFVKGPSLFFPIIDGSGVYHFNTHLNVKAVVHMTGPAGWHFAASKGPLLKFPADTHGLIVHRFNTIDDTTEATSTYAADGSVIENLSVEGGGNGNTTGHGIWIRAFCTLRHVEVQEFAEHGFFAAGALGAGGADEGNPSFTRLETCLAHQNGGSGCRIGGADANVIRTFGCDFRSNARWGLDDACFLGNVHVGNHVSSNGGDNDGGNSGVSCVASFGGNKYLLNVDASEADAVATEPGTNRGVWIGPDSALSGEVAWSGSDPEGTFHHGGGYKSIGTQARTVFLGCYMEPGKGSQLKLPTLWLGGHETFDTHGGHGGFAPDVNKTRMRGSYQLEAADSEWPQEPAPGAEVSLLLNWNRETLIGLLAPGDTGDGLRFPKWENGSKTWDITHQSGGPAVKYTTDLTTNSYGRSSAFGPGYAVFERGLVLGHFAGARHMHNATSMPTTGEHARGEIYWNRDQAQGGVIGWVCTSSGTPGTWAEIRGAGTQQAHIANPSGGGTVDAEARTAINSMLAVLEHFGFTAAS